MQYAHFSRLERDLDITVESVSALRERLAECINEMERGPAQTGPGPQALAYEAALALDTARRILIALVAAIDVEAIKGRPGIEAWRDKLLAQAGSQTMEELVKA